MVVSPKFGVWFDKNGEELRKLAVKLEVAEQTAKEARSQGHATTGTMPLGLKFVTWF